MKLSNIELDYMLHHLLQMADQSYEWYSEMYQLPIKSADYQEGLPKLQQAMMDSILINIFSKLIKFDHKDTRWIKDNGGFLPLAIKLVPSYKGDAQTLLMSLRRYDEKSDRYYIGANALKQYTFWSLPKYGKTDLQAWQKSREIMSRFGFDPKALEKGIRIAHQIITGKKCDIRTVKSQTT